MADKPKTLKSLTTGWASRTFTTARLGASLGGAALKKAVNTALDRESKPTTTDTDSAIQNAEALVEKMDQLKGLMMKFGQMVSYLDNSMPESAQKVLRKLQQGSKPMEYAVIEKVIESNLGAEIDALFDTFEPTPFAAASIGQVHKATLPDGRIVAVKVQYPEIAKTLDIDLDNMKYIMALGSIGNALDGPALVQELRQQMLEECDYRQEAAYQTHFRNLYHDLEGAVVPEVVPDYCGDQVITSAFITGVGFYEFIEDSTPKERDRAGELIFDATLTSLFERSMFNGDPHPGNYIFLPNNEIAFIDFGCVKVYRSEFLEHWKFMARTVIDGKRSAFPEAVDRIGFLKASTAQKFDFDYQWDVMQYLYEPFMTPNFRYNHEYVGRSYDLMLWKNPNKMRTPMPPDWLLANRLQWGLNSILAHLGASADWGSIFRRCVESPTIEAVKPERLSKTPA